ncbi:hypothetical protein HN031_01310 [Nocardioides sp. zg-1308]|uniref:hypothetical protein n=1 Tax=Nocardioides sp. zg-1308 TaxID=2736253 RepID=UPI001551EA50|nr:hypothetical protein [Nocardioides sp. zg-1308]NPD03326.1 hypothetical protein [Nocardioides sp. zg-1308]
MKRIACPTAALALAAVALVGTAGPSAATAQHCDDRTSADKVELDHQTTSVYVGAHATVCYKAGTRVMTTTVGEDGILTSTLLNGKGAPKGISYYVVVPDFPTSPE